MTETVQKPQALNNESKLITMCDNCHAIQISERIWIRYGFFTKRLYEKFTDNCKGTIYSYCPTCTYRLRKAN